MTLVVSTLNTNNHKTESMLTAVSGALDDQYSHFVSVDLVLTTYEASRYHSELISDVVPALMEFTVWWWKQKK